MRPIPSLFLPLLGASLLASAHAVAQQPTLTTSLLAPLSTSVLHGGAIGGASSVAFPDIISSAVSGGGAAGATALLRGSVTASEGAMGVLIQQEVSVNLSGGIVPAEAACETDVLLSFTAAVPMLVGLRIDHEFTGTAGCPLPLVEIDIGFDGTFEYSTSPLATGVELGLFSLSLGSVPTLVRVHTRLQTSVEGSGQSALFVRVVPGLPATAIQPAAAGCDIPFDSIGAQTRFDGGIDLCSTLSWNPAVMVFGLGLQPILLPSNGDLPCLLLPAVDLLLPMPVTNVLTLPLPPAVRPVTFWAQAVRFAPQGLLVTNALRVGAE